MAKYTAIAEFSGALAELLRKIMADIGGVALCSPAQRENAALGVYLYDLEEDREYTSRMVQSAAQRQYPSLFYSLYYMITPYADGDNRYRSVGEHRILGQVLQSLHDNAVFDPDTLSPLQLSGASGIRLEPLALCFEEKVRVWNALSLPYQTSLFYKATPVEIESSIIVPVRRVVSVDFGGGAFR